MNEAEENELRLLRKIERYGKALREIASYNAPELREWEEENAADMCEIASKALSR